MLRVQCRRSMSPHRRLLPPSQPLLLWLSTPTCHREGQRTLLFAALGAVGRFPWPFRDSPLPFPVALRLPITSWCNVPCPIVLSILSLIWPSNHNHNHHLAHRH